MRRGGAALALVLTILAGGARAEDAPDVAPVTRTDAPAPGRWTLDAGLAARERVSHIGSRSLTADAWPVVELQWGSRLHASLDDGIKWQAVRAGPFAAGPVAEYREAFNDKLPPRAGKLADAVEVGGFVQAATPLGGLEARLRHAVTGYDGNSADLAFDTGLPLGRRLFLTAEARAAWVDRDYLRAFRRAPAPVGPQARTEDYVTAGVQLGLAYALRPRWTLTALAAEDRLLSHVPARFGGERDLPGFSLVLTRRWSGRLR